MRLLFLLSASALLLGASAPQEASVKQEVHDMGGRICSMVLDDKLPVAPGALYRDAIEEAKWSREGFCHCVAAEFADDPNDRFGLMKATGDAEGEAMGAKIKDALNSCLPDVGDNADLAESEMSEDMEASDISLCQMLLDGDNMAPGFRAEDVNARLKTSGQSRDDLCQCSARKMANGAAAFEKEVEAAANPMVIYGSKLAGMINQCLR